MAETKFTLVIQAIDNATSVVRSLNGAIARTVAPARAASRAMRGLMVESGLKRVTSAAGDVGKSFGKLTSAVRGIAAAGAVATGALGGLFYALKQDADAGDMAVKSAQRAGTTVTEWQRLAYAADLSDTSSEELAKSLQAVSRNAVAAATGNQKAATWFRRAGINVKDQNGHMKSSVQIFNELSDLFQTMPDGMKKTALAQGLMSEAGANIIPLLNGGSKALREYSDEAERRGLVDEKLAREQEAFNDNQTRLFASMRGISKAISSALVPALNEILPPISEWIVANRELVGGKAKEFVDGLRESLPQFLAGLRDVLAVIWGVVKAVNAVVQFFGGWQTVIYAVAAVLGAKLVLALVGVTQAVVGLGLALLTTPIGWFMAGVALIAGAAYLIVRNWGPIKAWFGRLWGGIVDIFDKSVATIGDLVRFLTKTVLYPFIEMLRLVNSLLPDSAKQTAVGQKLQAGLNWLDQPAQSALGQAATAKVGGVLNVKIDAEGRARVTKAEGSGGFNLDVETGYTMAGAY